MVEDEGAQEIIHRRLDEEHDADHDEGEKNGKSEVLLNFHFMIEIDRCHHPAVDLRDHEDGTKTCDEGDKVEHHEVDNGDSKNGGREFPVGEEKTLKSRG